MIRRPLSLSAMFAVLGLLALSGCSPKADHAASPAAATAAVASDAGAAAPRPEPITAASGYEARLASAKRSPSGSTRVFARVMESYGAPKDKAAFATGLEYTPSPELQAHYLRLVQPKAPGAERFGCFIPRCRVRLCGPKFQDGVDCGDVFCPDPICGDFSDPLPQVPCKGGQAC